MAKRLTSKHGGGWVDRDDEREIDLATLAELMRSRRPALVPADRSDAIAAVRPAVIAFFAAHPAGVESLEQGQEIADVMRELALAPFRADFRVEPRWATTIDNLVRHLNELDPDIIHLSAHCRDGGLGLQDEHGNLETVSPEVLAELVATATCNTRVVLLNACSTLEHARALSRSVDVAIAMDGLISDRGARMFAARFYGALGNRKSVGNAVDQGCAKLGAVAWSERTLPRCATRVGIDAHRIVLSPRSAG